MGLVSWMHLHHRVNVYSGTRIQHRSIQTPSCFPLSPRMNINSGMQVHPDDESQIGRNVRP
ncbi:unnamed protein product [Schistosoma margrebowiei]|uniref:Uncharacterized protein n=1 Tax=Schistosoma margrebowiei TaxID=48269 RepID=A0A3P7ZEZ6_9TREM|nr:unnamed protein product [Schistosoma margrebowiei]